MWAPYGPTWALTCITSFTVLTPFMVFRHGQWPHIGNDQRGQRTGQQHRRRLGGSSREDPQITERSDHGEEPHRKHAQSTVLETNRLLSLLAGFKPAGDAKVFLSATETHYRDEEPHQFYPTD